MGRDAPDGGGGGTPDLHPHPTWEPSLDLVEDLPHPSPFSWDPFLPPDRPDGGLVAIPTLPAPCAPFPFLAPDPTPSQTLSEGLGPPCLTGGTAPTGKGLGPCPLFPGTTIPSPPGCPLPPPPCPLPGAGPGRQADRDCPLPPSCRPTPTHRPILPFLQQLEFYFPAADLPRQWTGLNPPASPVPFPFSPPHPHRHTPDRNLWMDVFMPSCHRWPSFPSPQEACYLFCWVVGVVPGLRTDRTGASPFVPATPFGTPRQAGTQEDRATHNSVPFLQFPPLLSLKKQTRKLPQKPHVTVEGAETSYYY